MRCKSVCYRFLSVYINRTPIFTDSCMIRIPRSFDNHHTIVMYGYFV